MKFFLVIFWMIAAPTIVVPTQAQVNVTQEHNHISRDGALHQFGFHANGRCESAAGFKLKQHRLTRLSKT
jgi:hypothetical protein